MYKKGFLVKVEIDVQKITCPGVWLCSNGKVSLQIHMFDSSIQTKTSKPTFPILCHEKYVFTKTFYNDHRLNELQRSLNNEWFYSELIQWKSCDEGCVLATFRTTLDDLLYPSSFVGSIAGMDIDLLMEPTKLFPGRISPKLEVSTKTTVETFFDLQSDSSRTTLVKLKPTISKQPHQKGFPRRVCHSVAFSRYDSCTHMPLHGSSRRCALCSTKEHPHRTRWMCTRAQKNTPLKRTKMKPPFKYSKVSDDLILRNNPNVVLRSDQSDLDKGSTIPYCYCASKKSKSANSQMIGNWLAQTYQDGRSRIHSKADNHEETCSLCTMYDGYFISNYPRTKSSRNSWITSRTKPPKLCWYCKQNYTGTYYPTVPAFRNASSCKCDMSDGSKKTVCFCSPTEKASTLAQQLHEKLARALDTNSRLFQKCIDYDDC